MSLTVRLPARVTVDLEAYCTARQITKTEAVIQALERLLADGDVAPTPYELGRNGFGADGTKSGPIARNSKRLLKEKFGVRARR